jgi:hypothetical protein
MLQATRRPSHLTKFDEDCLRYLRASFHFFVEAFVASGSLLCIPPSLSVPTQASAYFLASASSAASSCSFVKQQHASPHVPFLQNGHGLDLCSAPSRQAWTGHRDAKPQSENKLQRRTRFEARSYRIQPCCHCCHRSVRLRAPPQAPWENPCYHCCHRSVRLRAPPQAPRENPEALAWPLARPRPSLHSPGCPPAVQHQLSVDQRTTRVFKWGPVAPAGAVMGSGARLRPLRRSDT